MARFAAFGFSRHARQALQQQRFIRFLRFHQRRADFRQFAFLRTDFRRYFLRDRQRQQRHDAVGFHLKQALRKPPRLIGRHAAIINQETAEPIILDAKIREGMCLAASQWTAHQHVITKIAPRDFTDGQRYILGSQQRDMRGGNHLARQSLQPFRRQGMDGSRREGLRLRVRDHHHEAAKFAVPFPFQAKRPEIRAVVIGPWRRGRHRKALRESAKCGPGRIPRFIGCRQQRNLRNAARGKKDLRRARMHLIIQFNALGIGWGEHVIEAHAAAPVTFCARRDHSLSSTSATNAGASSCARWPSPSRVMMRAVG